jgi:hypothetical protein
MQLLEAQVQYHKRAVASRCAGAAAMRGIWQYVTPTVLAMYGHTGPAAWPGTFSTTPEDDE